MGEVYEGYDERLQRRVALKQIRPEAAADSDARQRFLREARAAARLNHPCLVQVYDLVETGEELWMVMELVDGQTLASHLEEQGPLDCSQALPLALDLADGLAAAHAAGVVHRDLKTENVILTGTGQAKILDFGLAKPFWQTENESSLSLPGHLLGTPRAMSPEQVMGRGVDPRSDLFSLGVLLYETLSGKSPFLGEDRRDTLKRICRQPQIPLYKHCPGIPPALSDLIDRLLEKDRTHRPQSAAEVAQALARLRAFEDGEAAAVDPRLPVGPSFDTQTTLGTAVSAPTPRSRRKDERRQVTVLCCDLVNPSEADEAGEPLDLEAFSEAMFELQALASETVERFEGYVGSVLGHRLLVYFGYPRAHEDAARRAVLAALSLVSRAQDEAESRLALRLGIHTGSLVVRSGPSQREQLALGQTLEGATRLQSLAQANWVVVSPVTHRLIEGFFRTESLEPLELPGVSEAVVGHRVLAPRRIHSRVERAAQTLAPLVGREGELELLHNRYELVQQGMGQVVLLSGEAGIGKSRLLRALEERLEAEAPKWLMAHASPYAQSSPLYATIELLRQALGLHTSPAPPAASARIEEALLRYGLPLPEIMPLFAALLSLPPDDRYPPAEMTPQKQREKTLEALLALLLGMAEREPVVAVVEDLHWADPSTLEFLGLLMEHSRAAPFLLLLTFRPSFQAFWGDRIQTHLTQIHLHRLTDPQVETLIHGLLRNQSLSHEVRGQIVAKTDGVPLFVEELTKTVLESDLAGDPNTDPQEPATIPMTLRDSFAARLDRLGTAKEVAQLASVLGREFSRDLVAAVSPLDETTLGHELERLVGAEILYRKGFSPPPRFPTTGSSATPSQATPSGATPSGATPSGRRSGATHYFFKHALLQDAAYESLLKGQRQEYHGHVAEVLEERFQQTATDQPEIVARHYTEARRFEPAIEHWQRAGLRAHGNSACSEAQGHFERGLKLMAHLPQGPERDRRELTLLMALGQTLAETVGWAAAETREAFARALKLCERSSDTREHFWASSGIWVSHFARGNLDQALDLARKMSRSAKSLRDSAQLSYSRNALAWTLHVLGEFRASLDSVGEGPTADGVYDAAGAVDKVEVPALHQVAGPTLWFLGYPEQALRHNEKAMALARQTSRASDLMRCHFYGMMEAYYRQERVLERAEEILALQQEYGLMWWEPIWQVFLAWGRIMEGQDGQDEEDDEEAGLRAIRQGIEIYRANGDRAIHSQLLAMLAEACARLGRIDEARQSLHEALESSNATGARLWEAEVHRLLGELDLSPQSQREKDVKSAETSFQRALEVARRQEAKSLELRAATSLARLWTEQGKRDEARKLLAGIYDWFTEGFDTQDLKDARALLDDLS